MVKQFKLILLDQPPTYFPGMEVSGTLVVEVDKPKKYNSITICLTGKGYVYWTECSGPSDRSSTYEGDETHVDLQSVVWSKSQAPDGMLPPGEHHYQFSFLLPQQIPSSFEGVPSLIEDATGWIRYTVQAKIHRNPPRISPQIETKIQVNSGETVDINAASLRLPFHHENQKTIGVLCCQSPGSVTTTIEVPRTGYCVGEEIPFRVTVENGSTKSVRVAAVLEERVKYTATNYRYHIDCTVRPIQQQSDRVEPQSTTVWAPEPSVLKIPVTTPTTFKTKVIERTFSLKFTTLIPDYRILINPSCSIPLTIGSAPYNPDRPTDGAMGPSAPFLPPLPQATPELTSFDPPSYQDAENTIVIGSVPYNPDPLTAA